MYPHELDVLYGDAILLKVVKKDVEEDLDTDMYEVVDMLTDPLILDKFFHCYMPSYGAFDYVGGKSSPLQIYYASSSTECEFYSQKSVNSQPKREAESIYKFPNQFDASTPLKHKRKVGSILDCSHIPSSVLSKCPRTI
jgi:hypothetical protein